MRRVFVVCVVYGVGLALLTAAEELHFRSEQELLQGLEDAAVEEQVAGLGGEAARYVDVGMLGFMDFMGVSNPVHLHFDMFLETDRFAFSKSLTLCLNGLVGK